MTDTRTLEAEWNERQGELGNTERAVLFRNLPAFINRRIHQQHVDFALHNMAPETRRLLDLGCGYGRMSKPILAAMPTIRAEGVELCEKFAEAYTRDVGPCAQQSVEAFQPCGEYDSILSVTCVQYVDKSHLRSVLEKYWSALRIGGHFICIEQYQNLFVTLRKSGWLSLSGPTGGDITYFRRGELRGLLSALPGAELVSERGIAGLPVGAPIMHNAVCVAKRD